MKHWWLLFGAVFGLVGVAAGAFGAHALRGVLGEGRLSVFETAVRYQMYHALVLIGLSLLSDRLWQSEGILRWSGRFFVAGVFSFSGSLYLLTLTGVEVFALATPVGGAALLAGWALLLIAALRENRQG